jgi:hypothetical protein
METNLKKLVPILGVICCSMTALFAGPYDSPDDKNNGNSDNQPKTAVPPGANMNGTDGPMAYISADYTYWTARQSGLAVALTNNYASGSTSPISGTVIYPSWYANSGFKVGLGSFLNHDGWDIGAEYTWFWNTNNPINTVTLNGTGISTWAAGNVGVPAVSGTLQSVGSNWNNWFQRVDASIGRAFFAGHYLTLRPFAGLLGAWDQQNFNINYTTTIPSTSAANWTNQQSWWGVGPYTGVDTSFHFPQMMDSSQFSLFLDMGAALPWSQYTLTQQFNTTDTTTTTAFSYGGVFNTTDAMLEMSLGLRWETVWNDSHSWSFLLSAAWEEQVWFQHNHFIQSGNADQQSGNYVMQGLTVKARVGF